mmetsp:Transcript_22816/g.51659  ORF Transcript_22816/g.51659 Transcript_22816/m.51659 type:complete len:89 (+) Transcript_22816:122-388(+)
MASGGMLVVGVISGGGHMCGDRMVRAREVRWVGLGWVGCGMEREAGSRAGFQVGCTPLSSRPAGKVALPVMPSVFVDGWSEAGFWCGC